ncbi:hypothetical protein [Mesorhizobium sp. B2-5-9]|nr:hypothetical protein [Mesorhizobium sp. B2-5-9]
MIESRTDIARAMIDATFISRHRSIVTSPKFVAIWTSPGGQLLHHATF